MMDISEKIRNISLAISGVLNVVLLSLLIFGQFHSLSNLKPQLAENSEVTELKQRIAGLNESIKAKTAQLQALNNQIETAKTASGISLTNEEFYSLDRQIYLVKFRSTEQREIWIKRNNETSNFSEELIQWLRSHDEFYVSDCLFRHSDGTVSVEEDCYILLPPCPTSLQDGDQPTIYKARTTVIKKVTKEEYITGE